ncbi:CpsD/CapB family tyrosine-protein kinase [Sphingomonas sp. IC4-52]|uniref:CpsD/CapB family tyrosine-protein kinase n=1 Tax=Sphingomonas sp. IC4-52 TaxID=2887202 RepID=UPI001D109648|nr:CpsD/CapB family tyrosine-protein kinase [Sphingomonas sp. IC4-52]MCC2978525.1 CpsD/CapB family tyrosine-protein kinase [Sphingomonas sp. IC4-52]
MNTSSDVAAAALSDVVPGAGGEQSSVAADAGSGAERRDRQAGLTGATTYAGEPPFGQLPNQDAFRPDGASDGGRPGYAFSRRLVCLSAPEGAAAASYRSLQTYLLARHIGDGRRGLALCSPQIGSGCTTVAVNLALACAQAGINTLLVDANLTRPAVHQFIAPADRVAGLAEMLMADSAGRVDEIRRDIRPNLSVLFAGGLTLGAAGLVPQQRRFKDIMDACMRSFDFTIVDAPATGGATDARHVAMSVRYAMIVARRDVTLLADMKRTADELSSDRVKLAGSFLTDF